jgi:hypothetical protein
MGRSNSGDDYEGSLEGGGSRVASQNEPVEELLLSRYVATRLRYTETYTHLRLGQPKGYTLANPAPDNIRQLMLSTLPEADLVVRTPAGVTIYEFGIWRPQAKLGQLLVYAELLRATPGFMNVKQEDIHLTLVQPQEDPEIERIAATYQVSYDVYPDPEVLQKIADRRGGR